MEMKIRIVALAMGSLAVSVMLAAIYVTIAYNLFAGFIN